MPAPRLSEFDLKAREILDRLAVSSPDGAAKLRKLLRNAKDAELLGFFNRLRVGPAAGDPSDFVRQAFAVLTDLRISALEATDAFVKLLRESDDGLLLGFFGQFKAAPLEGEAEPPRRPAQQEKTDEPKSPQMRKVIRIVDEPSGMRRHVETYEPFDAPGIAPGLDSQGFMLSPPEMPKPPERKYDKNDRLIGDHPKSVFPRTSVARRPGTHWSA